MKKCLLSIAMTMLILLHGTCINAAELQNGISVTVSTASASITGNIGGRQNNRFVTFYETKSDAAAAKYLGYADVEYNGAFSATIPISDHADKLVMVCEGKKWKADLDADSYIDVSKGSSAGIDVSVSNGIVTITGELGGNQNNRFVTFYTGTAGAVSANYLGYADVEYDGTFSATFPVLNTADILVIVYDGKKYETGLNGSSHIDIDGSVDAEKTEVFPSNPFDLPEIYPAITGSDTKERFIQHKNELPDEMRIMENIPDKQGKYSYYVDKNAENNGNGTIDSPFKTLDEALECVGKLSYAQKANGVGIYIREGVYTLKNTVHMSDEHSGTKGFPLRISAYNGEDVAFEIGTEIPGTMFRPVNESDTTGRIRLENLSNMYVADLSDVGITDFGKLISENENEIPKLSENGNAMHLARYPDTETRRVEMPVVKHGRAGESRGEFEITDGIEFAFSDNRPLTWQNDGNIAIHGGIGFEWYPTDIHVKNIGVNTSVNANTVSSDDNPKEGAVAPEERTWASPTWYYWYNILEETDNDGEYYIDRNSGKLYVYSSKNIYDKSFTYSLGDSPIIYANNLEYAIFDGIKFRDGSDSAFKLNNCNDIRIQNCSINNFSIYGVYIDGSRRCGVINTSLMNNGCGGIRIDGNDEEYSKLISCENYVQNCYFANPDSESHHPGISVYKSVGNVISHNLLQNFKSCAIIAGGSENIYEYNEIVNTVQRVDDMGSIYWSGYECFGNHIRYNYIHAPYTAEKKTTGQGNAIFADELGSDCYIYGNVIDGYKNAFKTNGGQNLTFYNNIIVNSNNEDPSFFSDTANFFNTSNGVWNRNVWSDEENLIKNNAGGFSYYFTGVMDLKAEPWKSRYPEVYDYVTMLDKYISDKSNSSYSWNGRWSSHRGSGVNYDWLNRGKYQWDGTGEQIYNEAKLRAPSGHVVSQNISYNGGDKKNVRLNDYYTLGLLDCENGPNLVTSSDPGFADITNGDYTLHTSSVSETLTEFEEIPFDKIGLKTIPAEWQGEFKNAIEFTNPIITNDTEVLFQWKKPMFATDFMLEISEKSDMSNPVISVLTNGNLLRTTLPKSAKQYYWTITAQSSAKDFKAGASTTAVSKLYDKTISFKDVNINEDASIYFKVMNVSDTSLNLKAYYAIYDESGKLIFINFVPVNAEKESITETYNVSAVTSGMGNAKLFLWDNGYMPYCVHEKP